MGRDKSIIIGDVHGCFSSLEKLMDKVYTGEETVIFLGDLMDRGPCSYEVLQYVIKLKDELGDNCIIIRGNHEQMLLDWPDDINWKNNGNEATIESFEKHGDSYNNYRRWIRDNTQFYYQSELFNCCHAGSYFSDITTNDRSVLIWDRDAFIYKWYNGKPTFIGHTPLNYPVLSDGENHIKLEYDREYKLQNGLIDIDTGCVYDDCLTCAVVDNKSGVFVLTK